MSESIKVVCMAIMIVLAITAVMVWFDDQPTGMTWLLRIATPILALACLVPAVWDMVRPDKAPDFLKKIAGHQFNCEGFCFAITTTVVKHVCVIQAHFQNQFERRFVGQITLKPESRGSGRAIDIHVDCPGGAAGVVSMPIGVSDAQQGRARKYEVLAGVYYPKGKGKQLRYRSGLYIRSDESFDASLGKPGGVMGAMGKLTKQLVKLELPGDVLEQLPASAEANTEILWTLKKAQAGKKKST